MLRTAEGESCLALVLPQPLLQALHCAEGLSLWSLPLIPPFDALGSPKLIAQLPLDGVGH